MAKNILYVIPTLDVGGTEMQLALLARRLAGTGFQPHILCLQGGGDLVPSIRKAGIPIEILRGKEALSLGACRAVKKYCLKWEIHILHTFLFGMDLGAVRGARAAGVLSVVTSRRQIPDWKERRHLRVQGMANKKTDWVLCNSEAVHDFICHQEGWPREKAGVIYNGFPEDSIPSAPLCPVYTEERKREALRSYVLTEDEHALVCVANFAPVKNHVGLLDGLKSILYKGERIRLFFVGDGPMREEVERYAEENRLSMATEFLGKRLDRLKILSECDALVLPSLNEGFPNAVLEAQALGIPVIASKTGGIPELVQHEKTGWTFDPKNPEDIAATIWKVLQDREEAFLVASNAQSRVRKLFTARNMVARHVETYEALLAGENPSLRS